MKPPKTLSVQEKKMSVQNGSDRAFIVFHHTASTT